MLSQGWKSVDFNVYGDGAGTQANFNSGSTVVVQILTNPKLDGSFTPLCASQGGSVTLETNNLSVIGQCCSIAGALPGIQFTETNASGVTPPACNYSGPAITFASGDVLNGSKLNPQPNIAFQITGDATGIAGWATGWDTAPPSAQEFPTNPDVPVNSSATVPPGCHTLYVVAWDGAGISTTNSWGSVCSWCGGACGVCCSAGNVCAANAEGQSACVNAAYVCNGAYLSCGSAPGSQCGSLTNDCGAKIDCGVCATGGPWPSVCEEGTCVTQVNCAAGYTWNGTACVVASGGGSSGGGGGIRHSCDPCDGAWPHCRCM
jgi:hypothetical protein